MRSVFPTKKKAYIAWEVYERMALTLCECLQACPIDYGSHVPSSQSQALHQTQVPKESISFPKPRPLNPTIMLLRSRVSAFLFLLHEKLEPPYPPASDIAAPGMYCLRSQNLIFFSGESPQIPNSSCPRMHTRISSFPMVKLLPSPFKAFLFAKSNHLPKPPSLSYSYLPLTFSLLSEYFSALALVISPEGSHWLLAPYNHVTKLIWWPKHLSIPFPSPKSKSYFLLTVGL